MGNLKNIKREDTEQSRLPFRIQKKCLSLPWSKKVKDMAQLNQAQRYTIGVMYANNCSKTMIANAIGVHKSTIGRELSRNKDEKSGTYKYDIAQAKCEKRHHEKPKRTRMNDEVRTFVVNKLSIDWSPEQISGYAKANGIACVSHETIYRMVWDDKSDGGELYTHLRRKGRHKAKRGSKNAYRGLIPNRVDIDERPKEVDQKERFGDLEGDTIVGKNHKGSIVTLNDRAMGLSWSARLPDKNSDNVADAIIDMLLPFKGYLHTLTFDNGREFAHHERVSEALGIKIFFAKPYHSWERGANENLNGLYRQYIPKGTAFEDVTDEQLTMARWLINTRPRKRFNFVSPIQKIYATFTNDTNFINILNKVAFIT